MSWQLQDAKNKLSKVVQEAERSGPQVITVRGQEAAVVLSVKDYRKLTGRKGSLVEFLQKSPWADVELPLERSTDTGRDVEL
ncbi:MAG: type II toxin-antitoxin system Phd/YefM family antitoxin [Dysgonamonadaceae bacterium]